MLNILVIGCGMYVCGKNTDGYGTILPALMEAYRRKLIQSVTVAAATHKSIAVLAAKEKELRERMAVSLPVYGFPTDKDNPQEYRRLLEERNFDAAIVCVPDHLHHQVAGDCLDAGLHTLVVKPFTATLKEADDLTRRAAAANLYGAVEFHKRYDEANIKARDLIGEGALGDLLYINVNYSQRKMIPEQVFRGWCEKTNIFQYLGVHYADLICFLTGAEPARSMAVGQKSHLVRQGLDTYDAIQVMTEWVSKENGNRFVSTILVNWIDPDTTTAMSDQKILIVGTKGRYDSDQKNRGVQIVTDGGGVEDFNPYFSQLYRTADGRFEFRGYGERSVRQFLLDVRALREGTCSIDELAAGRPSFRQSLVSSRIVDQARESLEKGNVWVEKCDIYCH